MHYHVIRARIFHGCHVLLAASLSRLVTVTTVTDYSVGHLKEDISLGRMF